MSLRTVARAAANPIACLGVAIALVGGTGVATAATGGNFILGRSNSATTQTYLTNSSGSALGLTSKYGTPPFTVGNTVKVPRLNADYLDNLDSGAFQRRITATCPGGAITAVGSTGGVTCAALPKKVRTAAALGETALGTFGGVTVNVSCTRVDDTEGERFFGYLYLTGGTGIANGHVTSSLYSEVHSVAPFGAAIPVFGTGAKTPTIETPGFAVSRQTLIAMLDVNGVVTQLTLHMLLDGRDLSETAKPCTVWGTAI
ncbi:MAG TPA: hypothetical protein VF519_14525 [Mycobacteriales bacterium]|jgi:hypothetical protein